MFEIANIMKGKPLTEETRFKILNTKKVNLKVWKYLSSRFENLKIEVRGEYEGKILDLMKRELLEGMCWETTESAIVFFNDDDYIERGVLKFEEHKDYEHSWICFQFEGEEYAFDPCLNLLCKKRWYTKIFEIKVVAQVHAKEVREDLIYRIEHPELSHMDWGENKELKSFLDSFFAHISNKENRGVHVTGTDDITSPMYRNNTGYKAIIEDNKIKSLTAHYYLNC